MTARVQGTIDAYYAALESGAQAFDPDRLRALLSPDLDFEGPLAGHVTGAEAFINGVSGFAETLRRLVMLQRLHDGNRAAAIYDAEMPAGTIRFAEFFDVVDGHITSLRLLYNGPDYLAAGGR